MDKGLRTRSGRPVLDCGSLLPGLGGIRQVVYFLHAELMKEMFVVGSRFCSRNEFGVSKIAK